jgi:hypothetical protein
MPSLFMASVCLCLSVQTDGLWKCSYSLLDKAGICPDDVVKHCIWGFPIFRAKKCLGTAPFWVITHRVVYRLRTITPTRCTNFSNLFLQWNSTCFGQFICPSSGVFHCTHSSGICQCFSTFMRPRPGNSPLFSHKTRARSQQIYS